MIDKNKDADIIRKCITESLPDRDIIFEMMLKEQKRWGLPLSVALLAFQNVNIYKPNTKRYNSKILYIKNKFIDDYTDEIFRKKIIQNSIIQNSLREYYLTITSLYIDEYSILMSELDELLDIKEDKCKEDKCNSKDLYKCKEESLDKCNSKDLYKCKEESLDKCNCRNIGFGFCFC